MTNEIKQVLGEFLQDIREAKNFAIEQIPDVLQEMVAYHATMAWAGIAGALILAVVGFCLIRLAHKKIDSDMCIEIFGTIVLLAVFIIMMTISLPTAVKATFFPKWFIVDTLVDKIN